MVIHGEEKEYRIGDRNRNEISLNNFKNCDSGSD
jgi:hypothetical protein